MNLVIAKRLMNIKKKIENHSFIEAENFKKFRQKLFQMYSVDDLNHEEQKSTKNETSSKVHHKYKLPDFDYYVPQIDSKLSPNKNIFTKVTLDNNKTEKKLKINKEDEKYNLNRNETNHKSKSQNNQITQSIIYII